MVVYINDNVMKAGMIVFMLTMWIVIIRQRDDNIVVSNRGTRTQAPSLAEDGAKFRPFVILSQSTAPVRSTPGIKT